MRRHNSKIPPRKHISSVSHETRFKHKAGDCGHSQCSQCHPYKFPKRKPTRKEVNHAEDIG
jgi:hypothetical protein